VVRVALVVPRYGFTAVRRNTLKRRLRELSRTVVLRVPASRDLLIRARPEAYAAKFAQLETAMRSLTPQLDRSSRTAPDEQ
jgi:ribonuclease P protein component